MCCTHWAVIGCWRGLYLLLGTFYKWTCILHDVRLAASRISLICINDHCYKCLYYKLTCNELFTFSISWGYRQVFEEYSSRLRHRYPNLQITGENFPPPQINSYIASVLGVLKLVLIGMIVTGTNPFTALNMDTPNIWLWATENKVSVVKYLKHSPFVVGNLQSELTRPLF